MVQRLRRDRPKWVDKGASAVEYGLLIAAMAAVIVGIVFGFGRLLSDTFDNTSKCIESQGQSPGNQFCPN
jgi:pilus assembly protein Flp/PilA